MTKKQTKKKAEKEWYIGIDFGTSNTCVIAYEAICRMIYHDNMWGSGIFDKFYNIPTLIAQDGVLKSDTEEEPDRSFFVGAEANLHPILRPFKGLKDAAREITPNNGLFGKTSIEYPFEECGLESTLDMGYADYFFPVKVRELIVQFLKRVLHVEDQALGINEETVKKIVIGCPASKIDKGNGCKISYEDTLKGLLAECFTGNPKNKDFIGCKDNDGNQYDGIITVSSEPELAGVTYLYTENTREQRKVLVIDVGGGTTDFSVLTYSDEEVKAVNIGSCEVAGNAIDKVIFNLLPEGIVHSKAKCRQWKENLFAIRDEDSTSNIINPRETSQLEENQSVIKINSYNLHYCKKISNNCIVLTEGKLFDDKNRKEVEGTKITEVYDKIGDALEAALDKHNITEINTIFFVGGTSIIAPLRKKLVEVVTGTNKDGTLKYCAYNFNDKTDVIDMFGENTRRIEDGTSPFPVTCYNAVAIGACIKAMGKQYLECRREVRCEVEFYNRTFTCKQSGNDLLLKTSKAIMFAYIYFDNKAVVNFKDSITYDFHKPKQERERFDNTTIGLQVDGEQEKKFRISEKEINKIEDGLLIYLTIDKNSIQYRACCCNSNFERLDEEGKQTFINRAKKVKLTQIDG